jgi:hypothetical protein
MELMCRTEPLLSLPKKGGHGRCLEAERVLQGMVSNHLFPELSESKAGIISPKAFSLGESQ